MSSVELTGNELLEVIDQALSDECSFVDAFTIDEMVEVAEAVKGAVA